MHISTLYCSSYACEPTLTGHMDIVHEGTSIKINFSEKDCRAIQEIAIKAYEKDRQKIIDDLYLHTPAFIALAPPDPNISEAEFFAVVEDTSDEVPF